MKNISMTGSNNQSDQAHYAQKQIKCIHSHTDILLQCAKVTKKRKIAMQNSLNKNSMTHRKFSLKNTYPQAYLRK